MTRESSEPTTTDTLQTWLGSAYTTARSKLGQAVRWVQTEFDSRFGPGSGRGESRGTTVTVERGPAARSAKSGEEASITSSIDAPSEPMSDVGEEPTDSDSVHDGDEEAATGMEHRDEPVDSLSGIGPAYADRLSEAGVETVSELIAADPASLAEATGLGEGRISSWIDQATSE